MNPTLVLEGPPSVSSLSYCDAYTQAAIDSSQGGICSLKKKAHISFSHVFLIAEVSAHTIGNPYFNSLANVCFIRVSAPVLFFPSCRIRRYFVTQSLNETASMQITIPFPPSYLRAGAGERDLTISSCLRCVVCRFHTERFS